ARSDATVASLRTWSMLHCSSRNSPCWGSGHRSRTNHSRALPPAQRLRQRLGTAAERFGAVEMEAQAATDMRIDWFVRSADARMRWSFEVTRERSASRDRVALRGSRRSHRNANDLG